MSEENTEQTVDQQTNNQAGEQQTDTTTEKVEEKVFKQEDVNNIVAKESKKATEKLLKELGIEDFENAKDGLAKFKEWQDSQKTEQEKQSEAMQELETTNNNLSNENTSLKAQISAMKQGVNAESVEDVVALAERQVSDDVTIDDAIKQIIEKYPYFGTQEEEKQQSPQIVTPGNPNGGSNKEPDPFSAKLAKYK
ncbi:hypothetical protein GCM10011409_00120 [Lentibacillus populi]|uniref:Scaffolding protein n=1 Tax=Lentibacillus populi TaxID=1827502 RepID=A0A9W5X3U5_9BACI|nr:hypothetical protein [Lentibacillus populi]GGB26785.1 hypothetical protein GCM10011409_00120 [Lentibacillus populi]